MSYLVNQSRVHSLTINGTDYTDALIQWSVSDSSANRNGFITTSGSLELGSYSGGPEVEDYDRSLRALNDSGIPFVPHVLVGLHYGKLRGEFQALKMIL